MSGNLGPNASTKGENTSKTTSKSSYDRLDINKLYKGKTAEPVAKTVTQKHGMQTLGKAPPARRAGASLVKPETTTNDSSNSSVPPQQPQQTPSSNLGQPIQTHQKWSNTSHPPGPPSPLNVPNVPSTGPPMHDKNWSGGPDGGGNYQSQRFAQEFPSLDSGSEPTRGSLVNSNQQPGSGLQTSSKSHDNQYGPGPILRPQTEGNWNQGGGRGMTRPPGPPGPNAPVREPGPERPNLGGPTPPPMSLGQGGPAPPPLGAYPMQYRGMPPFMYPNSGPPGQGYYPPPGPGMPRYGMPVPPGAPPPGPRDSSDGHRESNRNRGPPPPMRPTQQFAVKPIIRQEDMRRMDDIDQEGTWSSVRDDVDYNKRISFSDDESEERRDSKRSSERKPEQERQDVERVDRKPVRILERQSSTNEREPQPRDQDQRFDHGNKEHGGYDQDNEDDRNKQRRSNVPYDIKDRDRGVRRGRDPREDDWRSNNSNRFDDDGRNKKGTGSVSGPIVRVDPRGPQDFANKQFSNLPPRLLRQQQQQNIQSSFTGNQRKTPSPVAIQLTGKDREKDFQRDRDWDRERERTQPTAQYRILERNRGDSESSTASIRDKRIGNNEFDSRSYVKEQSRVNSESQREKSKESESPKDKSESGESRTDTKRSEESKSSFRSKSGFTSSWADEVDEDDFEDVRKSVREPSHTVNPDLVKVEERTVPKRVYIQQRQVENMTTHKTEPQQEQKMLNEIPKQDKPAERPRSTAWGERESREKSRNDVENLSQLPEVVEASKTSEREIILSEKAQQLILQSSREDHVGEHFDKNQEDDRYSNKDLDKKDSKERIERHDLEKGRDRFGSHKVDTRQDRDRGNNFNRDRQQQRPGRWGSNEFRRDNRTPEREFNVSSGRSSATDNSSASFASSNKVHPENEAPTRAGALDKSRSNEILKEGSPVYSKEVSDGINKEKLDIDRDETRQKDMDRRNRNSQDDGDSDSRGNYKGVGGGRNRETRERQGHAVYQPRAGWGRQDTRGKGRGGRDQYDRPRRNDFERDQDRPLNRDERDAEHSKEKPNEEDSGSLNYETGKEGVADDDGFKTERESGAGESNKKSSKSPVSNKRNIRGGNRLQGYGPPSDKNPFSSACSNKDDDSIKEKQSEPNNKINPATQTGPVPLMELGDISPPNMPSRARHHGGRGRGGGGMPPRMQDSYSFRGGNKRGRGDAKPLMSITSNDLERNEWESGSESGEEDSKKNQSTGSKVKKEGNKVSGNEKYRQNQNLIRNPSTKANIAGSNNSELTNCANTQDPANNNKGKGALSGRSGTSNSDLDSYSSAIGGDVPQPGSTSDNSENVDGEGYQSQMQNKKNVNAKDKSHFNSNKNLRNDKATTKDRKIKNPPYDARPSTTKDIPPRFQKHQQGNQAQYSSKVGDGSNNSIKESQGQPNAWDKPVTSDTKSDQNSQGAVTNAQGLGGETKDSVVIKNSVAAMPGIHPSGTNSAATMDSAGGPVKTMIFENRNYKTISNTSKAPGSIKLVDTKSDSLTSGLDLPKDMPLTFGKGVGEESTELDFDFEQSNNQSQTSQSISSHHSSSKPTPIGQPSRSYTSHQPSPISPLAADLNEKIQSVKRVWDAPSMPSVAEQVGVCGSEDNAFHGGFGNDSFKSSDSSNRDFSSSLQQPQSGYAPGSSPAISAISKPDSSTSPNSASMRQVKSQQQSSMDSQSHGGMSSSPFAYSMPQQHQTNAFGGMSAVPSPPAVMYGSSQALHGGHHAGVYQAFPHVEASQVMNTTGRSQYGQYSNPQGAAGSGPYGLSASIFMPSIDTGYQPMSSFQHQQQHSQSGPQGQAPNQNSRISPGPMTTSGGGSAGGVMMNSSGMKNQGGSGAHPNMSHQHQHQVLSGNHSQQGYSHNQMSHHHHAGAMSHHQHAVGPVGPAKAGTYTQGGIAAQSQQLFIPFDPNQQSVMNFGQNYISSGIRSAPPPGGPLPSATTPVQALQSSSSYYSGNSGNQVYHGSNQPGNLQQLHVAVAPNPQALQNLQTATQQLGMQFQSPLNIQQYNTQAATTVSALNLGGQLMRPGPPGHTHSFMKQPGLELVQQQSQQMKSHESMMNQAWNTQGFSLNQGFHGGGNKAGGNTNSGNNIGSQRKGNHQMGNMGNMGGMKYMSNTGGGYPGQKGGGRFSGPGPIQRPVSTSPSTGPPGSIISSIPTGVLHSGPIGVGPGLKPKHMTNDNANKHMNQPNTGMEEGLLDKFMTESVHRSIPGPRDSSKIIMPSSRLVEDHSKDHNGADSSSLKNPNLTIAPANNSPINSSEK